MLVSCQTESNPDPAIPEMCQEWAFYAEPCNGAASLCQRAYDQVAYATTHNSMANAADEWLWPNQNLTMKEQLAAGVRAFMIDTHYDETNADLIPSLCHGHCALGQISLSDALEQFSAFLACNPQQILTLIIEAYVSAEDTRNAFEEAGLTQWAYTHESGRPWPTLNTLIERDQRLIVLSDEGEQTDWYMPVWDHAFETHFSVEQIDDFSCEPNRGSTDNALFILNHFLSAPLPSADLALQANLAPLFSTRAESCQTRFNRIPNFVTVDFFDLGDTKMVVDQLNGL